MSLYKLGTAWGFEPKILESSSLYEGPNKCLGFSILLWLYSPICHSLCLLVAEGKVQSVDPWGAALMKKGLHKPYYTQYLAHLWGSLPLSLNICRLGIKLRCMVFFSLRLFSEWTVTKVEKLWCLGFERNFGCLGEGWEEPFSELCFGSGVFSP